MAPRLVKPLWYVIVGTGVAGGVIYWANRPRTLPGSSSPMVPPPTSTGGSLRPPRFPSVKDRAEQLAALKASQDKGHQAAPTASSTPSASGPYDLLVIGGGATGAGIALDAVTRGLKVALVERDDFGSGTSSKSTKLVHGGVRYLEKAVWELDYNQ